MFCCLQTVTEVWSYVDDQKCHLVLIKSLPRQKSTTRLYQGASFFLIVCHTCSLHILAGRLQKTGKYPCAVCLTGTGSNSICCGVCSCWVHKKCSGIKGPLKVDPGYMCPRCVVTEYYLAWNELTPKTAKHGEDVCDHDWAARPHPLLKINSGLFK